MKKETQEDLFEAQTTWFHVFNAMVASGDVAKMGPFAITTYLVIKSYTNFSSGRVFPSIETIVLKSGISRRQVIRSLAVLEEEGYITKIKVGRKNNYQLREKIEIRDKQGRPSAVATWDYLPSTVGEARAELKKFLLTGVPDGKIVYIENFNINIQVNQAGATGIISNQAPIDKICTEKE